MQAKPNQRPTPPPLLPFFMIWGSMLASQAMIFLVSQTSITGKTGELESPVGAPPVFVFATVAAVFAIGAMAVPRFLLVGARRELAARAVEPTLKEVGDKVLILWIARWALLEAVVMIGFVAAMLRAEPSLMLPFAAFSLAGFVASAPSEARLRASLLL